MKTNRKGQKDGNDKLVYGCLKVISLIQAVTLINR